MAAQHEEIEAAEHEGIVIVVETIVTEVLARDGRVRAVATQRQAPAANTAGSGAWAPVAGSEAELEATAVLVAIGEEPDPSILPAGAGIEVSAWAGIVADPRTAATGRAGVFAGGDVVSGPKTIIDAVASGRRAAGAIHEFLAGATNGEAEIMAAVRVPPTPDARLRLDLDARARVRTPLPMLDRSSGLTKAPGFGEAEARAEASRCFRCDAIYSCPTVDVVAGRGPGDGPGRQVAAPVQVQSQVPTAASAGGAS
jgi:NADPH-dependent glutamate synthase beta subunit-like oxidoreductase